MIRSFVDEAVASMLKAEEIALVAHGKSEPLELKRWAACLSRVPDRWFLLCADLDAVKCVVLDRYDALTAVAVDGKPYASLLGLPRRSS